MLRELQQHLLAVNGRVSGSIHISRIPFEWRQVLCSDIYISNLVGFIVDEAHWDQV